MKTTIVPDGTVETWYDRKTRSYVTVRKNALGDQVGDASYDGDRESAKLAHRWMVNGPKCSKKEQS